MVKTLLVNSRGNLLATGTTTAGTSQIWKLATTALTNTTEGSGEMPYRSPGIVSKLYVRVIANSTTASSTVFVRKNRVDTLLKVTIPAGAAGIGEFEDSVNTVTVAEGDKLAYRTQSGGTGTFTMALISVVFDATTNCVSKFAPVGAGIFQASQSQYMPLSGARSGIASTEASVEHIIKVPGIVKNAYVNVATNPRTTPTIITLRKNRTSTPITFTFAGGEIGVKEDLVNTVSYGIDDKVTWQITTDTGTENTSINVSIEYETTTNQGFITAGSMGGSADITVAPSTTEYYTVGGAAIEGTTNEADAQMKLRQAFTFSNLTVYARANTITAPSTFILRKNGVDTAATVTIAASVTGFIVDTTHSVDFAPDDLISYKLVTGGTGTTLTIEQMAVWTLPLIAVTGSGGGSQGRSPLYRTRQVKRREPEIAIAIVRVRIPLEYEVEKLSVQVRGPLLVPQKPLIKYASAVLNVIERILPLPIKPTPPPPVQKIVRVSIPLTYEVTNLQLKAACSYQVDRLFTQEQQHKIVATSINFVLSDLI